MKLKLSSLYGKYGMYKRYTIINNKLEEIKEYSVSSLYPGMYIDRDTVNK